MSRFLGRYSPIVYALLRIIVGLMFACHGGQKVLGMFPDPAHTGGSLPPLFVFGGWIELIGGFMVAFGLLGDWAAFICSGQMAVAYFMAHHGKGGFFPIQNHGESAVLYCFIFLYIAFHGSGILSLDHLLFGNRRTGYSQPAESTATI